MTQEIGVPEVLSTRFVERSLADWHPFSVKDGFQWGHAREAVKEVANFNVFTRPLVVDLGSGKPGRYFNTGKFGIVQETKSGRNRELLGTVTDQYALIDPRTTASLWDEHVAQPVTSALMLGTRLIIMTELPDFKIGKDKVLNYFVLVNPMDGKNASQIMLTSVKIICENTLIAAMADATLRFKVVHDEHAPERMGVWLAQAWESSAPRLKSIEGAYKRMAKTKLSMGQVQTILKDAYPEPTAPKSHAPKDVMTTRMERHDYLVGRQKAYRQTALTLFRGAGTGFDDPALQGTAWGLYNAVVETSDFRQTKAEDDLDGITDSLMFGDRAAEKARAFRAIVKTAKLNIAA